MHTSGTRRNSPAFDWPNGRPVETGFPVFTSASNPAPSAGGIVNDRRERHLLLKLSDFVIEPGEKAHFTVAGKQTWNFMPLQPDFDYSTRSVLPTVREYLVVDVQKGVDQDPFVCTTNYSASNPIGDEVETASHHGN